MNKTLTDAVTEKEEITNPAESRSGRKRSPQEMAEYQEYQHLLRTLLPRLEQELERLKIELEVVRPKIGKWELPVELARIFSFEYNRKLTSKQFLEAELRNYQARCLSLYNRLKHF